MGYFPMRHKTRLDQLFLLQYQNPPPSEPFSLIAPSFHEGHVAMYLNSLGHSLYQVHQPSHF